MLYDYIGISGINFNAVKPTIFLSTFKRHPSLFELFKAIMFTFERPNVFDMLKCPKSIFKYP